MNVAFFTPPPPQRVGGLDAAIEGLWQALERRDWRVTNGFPEKPDHPTVAHFHGLWQRSFLPVAKTLRSAGVPYLVSPHGMLEPWAWRHKLWKKWPYFHLIEKRFLGRASCLLATAKSESCTLAAFFPHQRIETIPLGLSGGARPDYDSARQHLGWRKEERILLYLSRLHVKKGLDLLLQALATMPVPPDVRLVVVGDGPDDYVNSVHQFSARHAKTLPPIHWNDAVWGEARWPYFQGADLFCLPTHSENFGLAVLEACQVGTPVLTTTGTPWADHLTGGRGFICEPSIESIRTALTTALAQPNVDADARTELSTWAWKHFGWDHLADPYTDLYQSLLASAH